MQKCISSAESWRLEVNRYPILQQNLINRPSNPLQPADLPLGYGPSSTLLCRCVSLRFQFSAVVSCFCCCFRFGFCRRCRLRFCCRLRRRRLFGSTPIYLLSFSTWSFVSVYLLSFQLGRSSPSSCCRLSLLLQLGRRKRCVSCG